MQKASPGASKTNNSTKASTRFGDSSLEPGRAYSCSVTCICM